MTASQIFI